MQKPIFTRRFKLPCLYVANQIPIIAAALIGIGLLAPSSASYARDFPTKPIRFIVPYVPGGPTDLIARAIANPLATRLGQPVIVENKPGASGAIGANDVAKAAADGYTLLLSNIGDTVTVALGVKVPYEYERDLAPISLLGQTPFVLVVQPKIPATTVNELIDYAKANRDRINFGSSGTGSASQLAGELFKSLADFQAIHVPYKGQSAATMGLMGGQLTFMFANPVNALPQIRNGALRALAVTGEKRYPLLPDIPTVEEDGLPGYEVNAWFGIMTTAGTPNAIVTRLNREVLTVLNQPEVREKLAVLGVEAKGNSPDEFASLIKSEIDRWTDVVKAANIHIE